MLKLKLQYFGHLMQRTDSLEKTPVLGGIRGKRRRGMTEDEMVGWHHQFYRRVWASSGSWWWTRKPGVLQTMELQRVGHDWATELNWVWIMQFQHEILSKCMVGLINLVWGGVKENILEEVMLRQKEGDGFSQVKKQHLQRLRREKTWLLWETVNILERVIPFVSLHDSGK